MNWIIQQLRNDCNTETTGILHKVQFYWKGLENCMDHTSCQMGVRTMQDTFSKIEIMLTRKTRRQVIENLLLLLLLAVLAFVVYRRFFH